MEHVRVPHAPELVLVCAAWGGSIHELCVRDRQTIFASHCEGRNGDIRKVSLEAAQLQVGRPEVG